jgi:DNA end-binding protein Ku
MRFADELVTRRDLDAPRAAGRPKPRELRMAAQLVEALSEPWRPRRLHDEYRETVLAAIRAKARGKEIELPDDEPEEESDDLAATLEASLA